MSERKFGLKVTEEELKALIKHHSASIFEHEHPLTEVSERLHNLVKRLHNDKPEVEGDPRPNNKAW